MNSFSKPHFIGENDVVFVQVAAFDPFVALNLERVKAASSDEGRLLFWPFGDSGVFFEEFVLIFFIAEFIGTLLLIEEKLPSFLPKF